MRRFSYMGYGGGPDYVQALRDVVVVLMIDQLGWLATLASGSLFAVTGAVLWLFVRLEPRSAPSRHPREP